jgi:hypothetical protein
MKIPLTTNTTIWLLISAFQLFSFSAFSQNVRVANPDSQPVPVKVISGITLGDVTLNGGDASQAKQDTGNTSLSSIDTKLTSQATAANQTTGNTKLDTINTTLGGLSTAAKQDTAAGKLDTIISSHATAAKQDTAATKLDTLHTDLGLLATAAGQATIATNTTSRVGTGTVVSSSAYESGHVLKASAGTLVHISGYNSGPTQFILFFNSATVPANGTTAIKVLPVGAQSNFSSEVQITGLPFATGISVSNSSTAPTKTVGSADCFFTAVVL